MDLTNTNPFNLKTDGLSTPCRLIFMGIEQLEIVRFEKGLSGKPQFSQAFKDYATAFLYSSIQIPEDQLQSSSLKPFNKREVSLSDPEFGEAFYRFFFPKLKKNHPQDFIWEKL